MSLAEFNNYENFKIAPGDPLEILEHISLRTKNGYDEPSGSQPSSDYDITRNFKRYITAILGGVSI